MRWFERRRQSGAEGVAERGRKVRHVGGIDDSPVEAIPDLVDPIRRLTGDDGRQLVTAQVITGGHVGPAYGCGYRALRE